MCFLDDNYKIKIRGCNLSLRVIMKDNCKYVQKVRRFLTVGDIWIFY